jgi:hypothetical protein
MSQTPDEPSLQLSPQSTRRGHALARDQSLTEHGNASTLMVALGPRCLNCGSPDEHIAGSGRLPYCIAAGRTAVFAGTPSRASPRAALSRSSKAWTYALRLGAVFFRTLE